LTQRLEKIDVAILPINGRDYYRNEKDIIRNIDSAEAVLLAKQIGADLLIPVHHDLYEVNRVSPPFFVDMLMSLHREQCYHIFAPGEKYIYAKN
jgi:L-ascorbate metabolism protein UlaG (beta-lactamase superfamily)